MRAFLLLVLIILVAGSPFARGQPLSDVAGHWAEERISTLLARGIAQPFPDQTFRPQESITRGEFIRWLVGAAGWSLRPIAVSSFVDVPVWHPAAAYVETALAQGLITRVPALLPDLPLPRVEAVAMAVRAIGDGFEATVLAQAALPFEDLGALPDPQRGAIAVALLTDPPLLREPHAPAFRPQDPLTRGEAASLAGGVLEAVERGVVLHSTMDVANGLTLVVEKRGVLRAQPLWRVQVGAFTAESNADRLAARMRERGLPAVVEFQDGFYKVRVGAFTSAAEAALAKEQLGREGYPTWVVQTVPSFEALPGPSREAAVIVDPGAGFRIMPAVGDGRRMVRQRTSELARRLGAVAAMNGDFFAGNDPQGCLVINGEWLSEPDPQRSCARFALDGSVVIDRVRGDLTVSAGEVSTRLNGVNRDRRADELILYTPGYDASTRTNPFGVEAVIIQGVVTAVADLRGNTVIPRDGIVLSAHGRMRQWLLNTLQPGATVALQLRFVPALGDPRWQHVAHALGGGPRLLSGGQVVAAGEGFPSSLVDRRHPRSALGVLADGRIILLVVDGRQPAHSLGMTLLELTLELQRLGAVEAMNLDGGGSSTLVVAGRLVTLPSDETGERPVADALVIVPAQGP